ncbi:unnamed protein product [Polarella glacialis]|uniref:Uncharacterized protein n=1 Tax=Polarella glacialis TaxID=89957 RepID=A0A813K6Q0_POLGL|nr:unnamed protein product [Polarella glacialis]
MAMQLLPRSQERRSRRGGIAMLAGLALVSAVALSPLAAAFASPSSASRRSLGAAAVAAVLTFVKPQEALAQSANIASKDLDVEGFQDPPEVVEARTKALALERIRQDELYKEFRGWFAEFAKDGQTFDLRVELLTRMQKQILAERTLPQGVTRTDVVKGVKAVKFNIGCIKAKTKSDEDCKRLEKAFNKMLAAIDKVYDRSLVSAR